ncbi:MAG TPA: alpha-amylase family glycosyl hydrolase [Acidimicrobiales bacterium]|nr:alpha-amylase family glycosyl hydrolase [Acidimicrobiales bacterium]
MDTPWWQRAVVYQIYPRSFLDTNGDGVGDLEGIRRRLDHLAWLGVDAIWLSPFFTSPMADFGYDVADYCDVDPLFGTLEDFDRLLADAHTRNIKVLIDWVPNHSSDQHPWFIESRSSRDNPKRDWYVWRDGSPDAPPNNWIANFTGESAWTWDDTTEQWYLHLFLPEQPDLNWNNPEVVAAMHATLRFWLDRGVNGFRADVVHAIGKGRDLPDMPSGLDPVATTLFHDYAHTHTLLRDIRKLLNAYPGDRMMVGEVYILSTAKVAEYYGNGDELHLAFNFPPLHAPWDAVAWRRRIDRVLAEIVPRDAWPTWVLSNHDNPRHRTRYGGGEARARAAAVLLLTLAGTPFLYAGEELGLEDAIVPPDRVVDPGGRDPCRAPVPWDATPPHGWATADTWLPWPPEPDRRNTAALTDDPGSILHLYRRLLAARRVSDGLAIGAMRLLDAPDGVVAYERASDGDRRVVVVNFTDASVAVDVPGPPATVEVSSDGVDEGRPYSGVVPPSGALILR